MKKINVIDLDKTLIPFDSLFYFIIALLKTKELFAVLSFIFLRLTRVYDNTALKEKMLIKFRESKKRNEILEKLKNRIIRNLDNNVISLVQKKSDLDTINVLCSASPAVYVKLIGEHLGWHTIASDFYDEEYVNMRGKKKILFINKQFPQSTYKYNFAISDSKEDLDLLKLFDHYVLKKSKK